MDRRRIYISSVLVAVGIAFCAWTSLKPSEKKVIIESSDSSTESSVTEETVNESETKKIFPVYIGGAVNDPGVFQIEDNIYLYNLIEMAGGFTEDADADQIDRVYLIDHPQSIYIPRIGEDKDDFSIPSVGQISVNEEGPDGNGEKIDINSAGVSELSNLPGIGPKTAEKIISFREKNGRFETKEDIMKVSGIGESKYEKIKDLIFSG